MWISCFLFRHPPSSFTPHNAPRSASHALQSADTVIRTTNKALSLPPPLLRQYKSNHQDHEDSTPDIKMTKNNYAIRTCNTCKHPTGGCYPSPQYRLQYLLPCALPKGPPIRCCTLQCSRGITRGCPSDVPSKPVRCGFYPSPLPLLSSFGNFNQECHPNPREMQAKETEHDWHP